MAHTGLGTLGMVCGVGGGGGGGGYIHKFCSRMDFKLIVHYLETLKFVVTINWLQLSILTYRNPKVVNLTTTVTLS